MIRELAPVKQYKEEIRTICRYGRIPHVEDIVEAFDDSIHQLDLKGSEIDYSMLVNRLQSPFEFVEYYHSMYNEEEPSISRIKRIN